MFLPINNLTSPKCANQIYRRRKKKLKKKRIEGIKYSISKMYLLEKKIEQQGKKTNKHHNILSTDTRKTQWNKNNKNNHNPSNQLSKR